MTCPVLPVVKSGQLVGEFSTHLNSWFVYVIFVFLACTTIRHRRAEHPQNSCRRVPGAATHAWVVALFAWAGESCWRIISTLPVWLLAHGHFFGMYVEIAPIHHRSIAQLLCPRVTKSASPVLRNLKGNSMVTVQQRTLHYTPRQLCDDFRSRLLLLQWSSHAFIVQM